MRRFFTLLISVFLLFFIAIPKSYAGEIRVEDSAGLVRAFKKISDGGSASVRIKVSGDAPKDIKLIAGFGAPNGINGEHQKDGEIIFAGVGEGVWRIYSESHKVDILNVTISNQ